MNVLAGWLASFQKLHPQVTYQICSGNADHIKEQIERGTLDLGLLLDPVDISRYDIIRLPVKEQWGVHIREDSPLESSTVLAWKKTETFPPAVSALLDHIKKCLTPISSNPEAAL